MSFRGCKEVLVFLSEERKGVVFICLLFALSQATIFPILPSSETKFLREREMGLSISKRVCRSFQASPEFNSACDSVYEECLKLSQDAFSGVRPYQLLAASDRLHYSLSVMPHVHPLIAKWVPTPPTRSQVDKALREVVVVGKDTTLELGQAEFKAFAVEVFTDAVVSNAGKAVLRRIPIGIAGIAGVGMVSRSGKDLVRTAMGVYALGVATSIYLSLAI